MLLSHDHHDDNLDGAGRALLSSASTAITTIPGAKRLGGHARGLGHGRGRGWSFQHGLRSRSRHTLPPSAPVDPPDRGRGDWVRASVGRPGAGVLWISGDTVLYDLVRQVAHRLQVGTALLHLGGRFPISGPVRYTMTAKEAVELCRLARPRTVIPIHEKGEARSRKARGDRTRIRRCT